MTATNRVALGFVRESTLGTTPTTPRMRGARFTRDSMGAPPEFVDSEEIRADRMLGDPIMIMSAAKGGIEGELHYPVDNLFFSDLIRSAMWNTWTNMPQWDNDGTADSVITSAGVVNASRFEVVSGGASAVVGHLVRSTGFTASANNQVFRVATSAATHVTGTTLGLTAEAAPAATARLKVVGFEGASADITATSTGLGSTLLDFTTLSLAVGQWILIGGSAAGQKFATAALNTWVRITAIAATALTCDNLPSGWTTDSGSGKTIRVWTTDFIKNGTTVTGLSIEKGFLAQTTPVYMLNKGMVVNTLGFTLANRAKINWAAAFLGMSGQATTTAQDASIDAVSTGLIMAANANVGRLGEGGSQLSHPNGAREFSININNNARQIENLDVAYPVDIQPGEFQVTGRLGTYFGSIALLTKFYAGTATALNSRITKNGQAVIFDIPRAIYRGGGNPDVSGKNGDVQLPLDYQAALDTTLNAHLIISRCEYFDA